MLPVSFTCVNNLEWSSNISSLANRGLSYYQAYPLGSNIFIWMNEWLSTPKNNQIFLNFIFSFLIILLSASLFFKIKKGGSSQIVLVVNIFFMWIIFFITGPTPRFGMGIFLISIVTIAVFVKDFKVKLQRKYMKFFLLSLSFLAVAATPRFYSYSDLIENNFQNYSIVIPEYDFRPSEYSWGVVPVIEKDYEKCGAVYNCLANNEERTLLRYGNYFIFKK